MEVDNSDHHHTKRSRINCTGLLGDDSQLEEAKARQQQQQERMALVTAAASPWPASTPSHHPSSRIYRVSRASGGKDRHSKVYTAKGIRDRRVRLSVSTAIAFYDLQDRLGFDQPSKAIEWLIKAASAAIDKLPSLDSAFPDASKALLAEDKNLVERITGADGFEEQHGQQQQLTKSGCSSTSETSKGSVLSLSRSDNRVKARGRARERADAKEKEKDMTEDGNIHCSNNKSSNTVTATGGTARRGRNNGSSNGSTFTELLTGLATGSGTVSTNGGASQKPNWQLPAADYLGFIQSRKPQPQQIQFSPSTAHFASIAPMAMSPPGFNFTGGEQQHDQQEMHQFSFLQDHLMPATGAASPAEVPAASGDYNLNFSIASGLMGVNDRGTLQSNSQQQQSQYAGHHHHHHHHQLQRLSSPLDGPNSIPFFFSAPPAAAAAAPDGHFFDGRLQLWDGFRHADMKEKGKN